MKTLLIYLWFIRCWGGQRSPTKADTRQNDEDQPQADFMAALDLSQADIHILLVVVMIHLARQPPRAANLPR